MCLDVTVIICVFMVQENQSIVTGCLSQLPYYCLFALSLTLQVERVCMISFLNHNVVKSRTANVICTYKVYRDNF